MVDKTVKDLMIPLHDYALVPTGTAVLDAIRILRRTQASLPPDRQPPRAVLVVDREKRVIGQLGHLDFLRALEPKYNMLGDLNSLSRAGVSNEIIGTLIDNLSFWEGDLADACQRAGSVIVDDIMHPLTETIEDTAPLSEAIHKIVMWQTMRILVTRKKEVIGILRLADLFDEAADCLDKLGG